MSGRASFTYNSGYYGGAFHLISMVLYIYKGSELLFAHNYATSAGGTVNVLFPSTYIQSQDKCPIQFIGPSDANPVCSLDKLNLLDVNITFENNTAGILLTPYSTHFC